MKIHIKVEAVYGWLLFPKDFSQITKPSQYTIGSFSVKRVIEGEGTGIAEGFNLVAKGILIPKEQCCVGVLYELEGDYSQDSKGRWSLEVLSCVPAKPTNKQETIAFLSCGILKGVGKKTAEKLYCEFGEKVIEVIENDPMKLTSVPGISKNKAKLIGESYQTRGANVMGFAKKLREYKLPDEIALKAYEVLGKGGIELIDISVYHLVNRRILSFEQVEAAARASGKYNARDPIRIEKAILSVLIQNEAGGPLFPNGGNLFCKLTDLTSKVLLYLRNLDNDLYTVFEIMKSMDSRKLIHWDRERGIVYRYQTYEAEKESAEQVARQLRLPRLKKDNLRDELEKECLTRNLLLGDEQKDAVIMALEQPMSVITGFPGTGKTTIQQVILALLDKVYGEKAVLLAPTGRASKRMMESTGHVASTIHSALQLNESEELGKDKQPRITTDLLIVDEASMMDIYVFRALMRYTNAKRICIIGDIDQLPSVGCGCVLKDLIETPLISLTRLNRIYRQTKISGIIENAMHIRKGELKLTLDDTFRLATVDDEPAVQVICALYERMIQKYGKDDVILLSPYRRNGILCTNNLNQVLQNRLNPDIGQGTYLRRKDGSLVFRVGDPILLMKNMQEKGVVNGDVGRLKSISSDGDFITVDFYGKDVQFFHDDIQYLDLSYATTVHKSQGSEYKCVILVLSESMQLLLKRGIIYTAVTRAKDECCCIVSSKSAVVKAISTVDASIRYSRLTPTIKDVLHHLEEQENKKEKRAKALME